MASQAIIRPLPMYFNGKKIAEVSGGTYDIASGDTEQFGIEGLLGFSDGAMMTKMEADTIMPVQGLSTTLLDTLVNKKYCKIGIFADGRIHQIDMRITNANYTTDSKSGVAKGKFTFQGGAPTLT